MVPNHRTFDGMASMFGWMFGVSGVKNIIGMDFLEIGTGQYINHPVAALVCGASKAVTYDVKDNRVENYLESLDNVVLANRLLPHPSHSTLKENLKNIKGIAKRVEFTTTLPDDLFDMIFSYSTLEHVPENEIDGLLLYIRKHSKNHGLHYIDLNDPQRNNGLRYEGWVEKFKVFGWDWTTKFPDDKTYMIIQTQIK